LRSVGLIRDEDSWVEGKDGVVQKPDSTKVIEEFIGTYIKSSHWNLMGHLSKDNAAY